MVPIREQGPGEGVADRGIFRFGLDGCFRQRETLGDVGFPVFAVRVYQRPCATVEVASG